MTESVQSPGFRVTAVEPDKDGRMLFTKVWYLYLQQLSVLAGGTANVLEDDEGPIGGNSSDFLEMAFANFRQGIDQRPQPDVYSGSPVDDLGPVVQQLREEVFELRKAVQSLQQGTTVL